LWQHEFNKATAPLTNQLGPIAHSNDIGAEEDVEPDEKRQD
jgi:hypothetical protein